MKQVWNGQALGALFLGVALLALGWWLVDRLPPASPSDAASPPAVQAMAADSAPARQAASDPLDGSYRSTIELGSSYSGVFSDTSIITTPLNLGYILFPLDLEQNGTTVSGHVALTDTIVFTGEQSLDGTAVGPQVTGSYVDGRLELTSAPFHWELSPARTLSDGRKLSAQVVTRQFHLVSTAIDNGGATISADYRETMWGYAIDPVTVMGKATIERPHPTQLTPEAPSANFVARGVTSGNAPFIVDFANRSGGVIDSYQWDFGDGTGAGEENPSHTFTNAGRYTVKLAVTGPGGSDSLVRTEYIEVVAAGVPIADFSAVPYTGSAPLTVSFNDQSRGNITGRQWDFGDGNTSSEANPAHTYESAGVFTVKLTVTGPGGSHTRSVDEYIVVMGSGGGGTGEGGHSIYLPIGYD